MAMLQMQRIYIYALRKDRKPILELLQRQGVLEINDTVPEDDVFKKQDVSHAKLTFEKHIHQAEDALAILDRYNPEKKGMLSSLNGRTEVSAETYDAFKEKYEQVLSYVTSILKLDKEIAELKADILRTQAQIETLKPWSNLDIPLSFSGTKTTKCFIGTLPKEWTLEAVYSQLAEYMPIEVEIVSSSKEQTCIFILAGKDKANEVYDKLRAIEFSHPSILFDKAPAEQIADLDKVIVDAEARIKQLKDEILELVQYREDIKFLHDYERMRSDKYEVLGQLSQSKNLFIVSGYIPKKEVKILEETLKNKYKVEIEVETPAEDEEVPVLLKNNGFSEPLEGVVEGFSLPGSGETDPTMVMSLFYYLLFGIMLADAGYGLLMIAACGFCLVKFGKKMEKSMSNFIKMFLYCGVSTMFWGIMFGSYFGDIIDIVASNFFGVTNTPIIPPLWFYPVEKPMMMLTFSMILGLIHLLTGLIMKIYLLLKAKDYLAIIYDALSWFALIVSCTILLVSMEMIQNILSINVTVPNILVSVSAVIAITASIIIVLTNGRESKNPFKRFLKGIYALYGITGYLSDVLSYSRLLALGLASGVIGSVINKMAAMTTGSILGPVLFTIIVILGHAINIAINLLGAYVHTNRLQYVEFFGKFYEGGGRSFNPFTLRTKYYKIKE